MNEGNLSSTFQYALMYQKLGFSIIPLIKGTKRPSVKWAKYQTLRANEEQLQGWFKRAESLHDLAIITGRVSHVIEFDVDGEKAKAYFESAIAGMHDSEIQSKIKNTMKIRTPSGNINYILTIDTSYFANDESIKSSGTVKIVTAKLA